MYFIWFTNSIKIFRTPTVNKQYCRSFIAPINQFHELLFLNYFTEYYVSFKNRDFFIFPNKLEMRP